MFKQKYEKLNSYIVPDETLVNKVKGFSNRKKANTNNFKNIILKPAMALSLITVMFCSMPVLASVSAIYDLMYLVSPTVAQYFIPVQKSHENDGIKMEVVSTHIQDNEAKLYITMQDLTGNRIDETTDLNDSYSINKAFKGAIGNCYQVGYDKTTKTATFMVSIKDIEGNKIDGDKITFTIRNFMSNKKSWDNIKLPRLSDNINYNSKTMQTEFNGFSSAKNLTIDEVSKNVLTPETDIDFGVTDMKITGIGYVEDKLHIQVSAKNNREIDNHGEIYLKSNTTNNIEYCAYKLGFKSVENGNRMTYSEYVFDISKEDLQNYSFYGDFTAGGFYMEGIWQVTFPFEVNN